MKEFNRREFVKQGAGVAGVSMLPPAVRSVGKSKPISGSRPNIVVIMVDDMGFSDIGCYGSEIPTPNIDKLAAEGLRFTQFYNCGRCCPTRASLLTGLYPHQVGIGLMVKDYHTRGYTGDLSSNCVTIAEALQLGGYRTAMSGKWHVTPPELESKHNWPLQRGFEQFFGTIDGAGSYFDPSTLSRGNTPTKPSGDFYYTDAITENALDFMNSQANPKKPFFLYVAYTAPHYPLHARPEDIAKYHDTYTVGWDKMRAARYDRMRASGLVERHWLLSPRDARVPPWETAEYKDWEARRMGVYAAQVARMDHGVGEIVARIKELGQEENTLILFLSDNGGNLEELTSAVSDRESAPKEAPDGRPIQIGNDPTIIPGTAETYQSYGLPWANLSNTPFRFYKHFAHEGGISTPLIARWPGVIKNSVTWNHQVGHVMDILATCLDVAAVEYPKVHGGHDVIPLEGKSLVPIFSNGYRDGHDILCWEHQGNRAIREGKWKLVSNYPNYWELHDLEADRTELKDLVNYYPDRVNRMVDLYNSWADKVGVLPWTLPGMKPEQVTIPQYLRHT